MEETSISFYRGSAETLLSWALDRAFREAMALRTPLPDWVLSMPGMSGRKYRRLINGLVRYTPSARYLEVGSWAGSTACAAIAGNRCVCTCIDNWSQFGGPRDAFATHTNAARSQDVEFRSIEADFREVDYTDIGRFNIYMFDGPHEYQDQYDGVTIAQPALDSDYIQIVDDWNWPQVRQATLDAFGAAGLRIAYGIEVRTTQDDTHPTVATMENSDWHNGYLIAALRRT